MKTKPYNDENAAIKLKTQLKNVRKALPKREILSDVTQVNEHNLRLKLLQPSERVTIYQDAKKPKLVRDFDDDDAIRQHFDQVSSDNVTVERQQRLSHLHSLLEGDKENISPMRPSADEELIDVEQYEEVDEDDEDDEDDDEDEDEVDPTAPMEPCWNKAIFNELQHIMKKFSRKSLDDNDEDTYDVTMVAEYAPEIFNYMHELEHKLAPDANYMVNQDELKWEMRSVLIDWVVQVHNRFNLLPETLYLTVNYIDRFLSKRKVSLSRFQLVGAVALFIAAKYEEINCPTVQEVAYMADNAYSVDDFLKAERFMIDVLEFDMGWPGPMSFLRRTSKADDYDYETRTLAKYFLEITIMDARFVASQPSWLAAGAHYLSRRLLNRGEWTEAHVFYSGYTELQLRPLAEVLLNNCRHAATHHKAIFDKYQERRYKRSATFVQEYFHAIDS
jgi:G2/mitotic-specific cyclin 3/4